MRWQNPYRISSYGEQQKGEANKGSARQLVLEVEEFIRQAGWRAVHISEICMAFRVSRRTLHRAFSTVLDMGPVAYLQRKRLSLVYQTLKAGNPATMSVTAVAMQYGFLELGRFSGVYRTLFGELPSQTLHGR